MRKQPERGQALVLAMIALFILTLGMYTTYSISRGVYEKIQLQNAADATAYSLATLEARAFNFIAFANRAQVANYVHMMEQQSLLSHLTYIEGTAGHLSDVMLAGASAMPAGPAQVTAENAAKSMATFYQTMREAVQAMETFSPRYMELQTTNNYVLYGAAAAFALGVASQVAEGGTAYVKLNDADAELTDVSRALAAINVLSYGAAFDTTSFVRGDGEEGERARRAMTEIVNATRASSVLAEDFVLTRSMYTALGTLMGEGDFDTSKLGSLISASKDAANDSTMNGTTMMLSDEDGLPDLADLDKTDPGHSYLNRGGALASRDGSENLGKFFSAPDFASVVSTPDEGRHCRYEKPDPGRYGHMRAELMNPEGFAANVKCHSEDHEWTGFFGIEGGITPFINFRSKFRGVGVESTTFNQPDVWVFLHKKPSSMTLFRRQDPKFTFSHGSTQVDYTGGMAADGLMGSGVGDGFHALSRAQVYYHRAGAWQEMPNFFNPFWAARLAPKNAAIGSLGRGLGLPNSWAALIADNVWMF